MNEITIAVKYDNDNPTVSGRELHAALMIDTPYHKWFPRMCEYGFAEGIDFNSDKNVRVQIEGSRSVSREVTDHQLTIVNSRLFYRFHRDWRILKMKASLPFKYITAVKNGKHYVVFDYKDVNNKRKRKWVGTDLPEKCAKKVLSAKVDEIVSKFSEDFMSGKVANISKAVSANADGTANSSEYEFTAYLKHWLESAKPTIAFTTYDSYRHSIGRISEYFDREFPHLLLSEVTPLQLQKFYNDLYDLGRKGSTIRQYHVNIHRALKYAVKMDIIPANPDDKTDLPKAEKHESSFYNKEELDKLFEVFKGDRLELVVHIAAYYGLRKCEIIW